MHRHSAFCAVTLGLGVFLAGCDVATSPTGARTSTEPRLSPARPATRASGVTPSTDVVRIPVAFTIQPSGKAAIESCIGEAVSFAGDAVVIAHQTVLPDGSTSLDLFRLGPQGATAVGQSTGTVYRLVGGDVSAVVTPGSGGFTGTFAANLRAIGPDGAKDFLAHILEHISVTPAGEVTALVEIFSVECR